MNHRALNVSLQSAFLRSFRRAVTAIDSRFFRVMVAGSDRTFFRERVYCYELYHQLRSILKGFPLTIYGEVDKSGHPRRAERRIPDFVVHDPGDDKLNLVIVEVKSTQSKRGAFLKDIDTVNRYVESYGYRCGILLLVGKRLPKRFLSDFDDLIERRDGSIVMLWHENCNQPPVRVRPSL